VPDGFRKERHEGLQQARQVVEHRKKHPLGWYPGGFMLETALGQFEVPIAKIGPGEVIKQFDRLAEAELRQRLIDAVDGPRQPAQDPAVFQGEIGRGYRARRVALEVDQAEPCRIPDLGSEVATLLEPVAGLLGGWEFRIGSRPRAAGAEGFLAARAGELLGAHVHVLLLHRHQGVAVGADIRDGHARILRLGGHHGHLEAEGVGAVAVDDVERVDAVALALAHGLAKAVGDLRVDVDLGERNVAGVVEAADDHAGHPQRDDVARGGKHAGGVVAFQVGCAGWPAQPT
jgi:hypothetical protein